ncbi:conjugal transfer protein TraG N-terminal domain-containing protein [Halomonas sabkhae]|uniref:conjugal transfer protein TraG N-terminal domain-containing protein n=1 Tax=Halomonas sabkhae TaxID=626223 RepID=UPI0025B4CB03|nr:conjugal transfer protein TraG N-terminal domain-containing protein [Halomonas sabkhae]MDN3525298.1 conjugal transfer protein TraG N-terminal domain-containing protein [Halomonas sabkhae]
MNATLNVTDYMEMPLLMMAWVINNGIWDALLGTGLAIIPFIALILSEWFKARQEGDDEGNKGLLTINRIEAKMYAMILIAAFTCMPVMNLNFNPVATEEIERNGTSCSVAAIGEGEWGEGSLNMLDGQSAQIPLWWAFVHAVSKGMTNVAISKIPCAPDLQAIATEVDLEEIEDKGLAQQLEEFNSVCFSKATAKYISDHGQIAPKDGHDTAWAGSRHFRETSGYYDSLYAERPIDGFPFDPDRDMSRSNTGPGQPGYPTCKEWWENSENGLYTRLQGEISGMDRFLTALNQGTINKDVATEAMVRRLINPKEGVANGNQGGVTTGQLHGIDDNGDLLEGAGDLASNVAGAAGGIFGVIFGKVGMDMVKQAMPMVQYTMLMAVVICLPFVLTISSYSFKAAGMATFGLFALFFLTFWFELARWMNANLIDLLYASEGAKLGFLSGVTSIYDKNLLTFVNWAMYFILPSIWVMALGWSGMKVGGSVGQSLSDGSKSAKSAGDKGADMATGNSKGK